MSRIFGNFPVVPPQVAPIVQPMAAFTPSANQASQVSILIDWSLYNGSGAKQAVGIQYNFGQGVAGQATLDRISTVFVDNSASNVPVYVVFPDTGYAVVCAAGSQVVENVVSATVSPIVYGVGFTGGPQPFTNIIFVNRIVSPSQSADTNYVIPQYMASVFPGNPVLNQTPFRALAVGDLVAQASLSAITPLALTGTSALVIAIGFLNGSVNPGPVSLPVSFPPFHSMGQYIYVTAIYLNLTLTYGAFTGNSITSGFTSPNAYNRNIIFSDSLGCINIPVPFTGVRQTLNANPPQFLILAQLTNLQIKCRADATFTLSVDGPLGFSGSAINGGSNVFFNDVCKIGLFVTYTARDENTL